MVIDDAVIAELLTDSISWIDRLIEVNDAASQFTMLERGIIGAHLRECRVELKRREHEYAESKRGAAISRIGQRTSQAGEVQEGGSRSQHLPRRTP